MADVISIDHARALYAPAILARAVRNGECREQEERACEQAAAEARARWLADLATWPEPFQRVMRRRHWTAAYVDRCRREQGFSWRSSFDFVRADLAAIRTAAAALRTTRACGAASAISKRRRVLAASKRDLLEHLWLFGHRRIARGHRAPEASA